MMGGEGIEPFINLIDGKRDGQTFQDMKDYFYYAMVKSKTEDTTKTRKLDGRVPIDQLGNLMRAMGHYPTNKEIENMKTEVEFGNYTENCEKIDRFDLETFVKLFVNHRPVFGIGSKHIDDAFSEIFKDKDKKPQGKIPRENFLQELSSEGEPLMNQELGNLLEKLIGSSSIKEAFGDEVTPDSFYKNILSFEEVDNDEEFEDEEYDPALGDLEYEEAYSQNIIPEET